MKEKLKQQYDSLYASEESLYGSGKAIKLVRSLPKYISEGKVLDIGGGEGRNALYLAKRGYEVSVIDISEVGISSLQKVAKQTGLKIGTQVADITKTDFAEEYDAVLMSFVLHHLETDEAIELVKKAQSHTRGAGVHIIATFAGEGELYERNELKKCFYPSQKELEELYKGWEILLLEVKESTTRAKDKSGVRIKNQMIRLIVQKPK